jgi:hypothetical protein
MRINMTTVNNITRHPPGKVQWLDPRPVCSQRKAQSIVSALLPPPRQPVPSVALHLHQRLPSSGLASSLGLISRLVMQLLESRALEHSRVFNRTMLQHRDELSSTLGNSRLFNSLHSLGHGLQPSSLVLSPMGLLLFIKVQRLWARTISQLPLTPANIAALLPSLI